MNPSEDRGAIQVVVTDALRPAFEQWLDTRGLNLFRIPHLDANDDLVTYGIGVK